MTQSVKDSQAGCVGGTANKWVYHTPPADHRIDYIFTNNKVIDSHIVYVPVGGVFPSDHCPVFVEF